MKQFLIFSALCTFLCFTFGLHTVHAEESKVDMSKCITLTVKQGASIKLDFAASTAGVWVKVTGVKNEKVEEAPTYLHITFEQPQYEATGTEIKVYGAIEKFTCYDNGANLTALDVSQNVNLTHLACHWTKLSSLDLTQNVNLTDLDCRWTQLSSLDLTQNVNLTELACVGNQLSSLDLTQNVNLTQLWCDNNQLSSLDVSKCGNLTDLRCYENQLYSLYVSNTQLYELSIYKNNFTTSALNEIYCQLPDRTGKKGVIKPAGEEYEDVLLTRSTSKAITDGKNWAIQYVGGEKIEDISGNYTCGSTYELTLEPATIPNAFTYQGGKWETTVTSASNWKIDESMFPDWLSVEPKHGNSGTQVTVTAKRNTENSMRRGALTFVLTDDATKKQVVLLSQTKQPPLVVSPIEEYIFPAVGETKENYFTVESTRAWTVTSSNAEWNPVVTQSGEAGTTKVTIKSEANYSAEERKTELTFAQDYGKQVITLKQAGATIAVIPTEEYTFPAVGETKENYFTVESTGAWTVTSSNATWFPVETKSGEVGTTKITIKSEANYSAEERKTELTFALKANADVKQVVTLKQKGASISVTPSESYTFPYTEETKENFFTVESTSTWTVTSSNAAWNPVVTQAGEAGTMKITIKTDANNSRIERRTELTFSLNANTDIKQTVTLKQEGAPICVTPAEGYTFPYEGETKENFFTVESAGAWTVSSSNADWFPVATKEGEAGTTKVTIKTDANNSKDERSTELTFALKDNTNAKQTVTIKQKGATISVTPVGGYTFPYAGETKTFTVESSGAWTVTASNAEWLTIEPKSGAAGTTTVSIKADANNNQAERSTELTFALKDNADVKYVVKIKQAEKPTAVEDVLFAGISVAPNPFSSQLKIKNEEAVNAHYELVNTSGVVVRSGVLQGVETVLKTEKLKAGAYLLRIQYGSESKTLRVVKE